MSCKHLNALSTRGKMIIKEKKERRKRSERETRISMIHFHLFIRSLVLGMPWKIVGKLLEAIYKRLLLFEFCGVV
jgi:hypothetical protein